MNSSIAVQMISCVCLFVTPWTAAYLASLSFTVFQSLLELMSIESMMLSNHLILYHHFSSCLQSFLAWESFQVSRHFASGSQSIGASASASVLPMNIQDWFPLGLTDLIYLLAKKLSRVSSMINILYGPTIMSIYDAWKSHNFYDIDLCWQWCLCILICCFS